VADQKTNAIVTTGLRNNNMNGWGSQNLAVAEVQPALDKPHQIKLGQFYHYMEIIECDTGYPTETNPIDMK
jgi:hypothetical protein